jgi:hypothetical protein
MDMELDYVTNSPSTTLMTFPNGSFRVGIPISENVSFEPKILFQYFHASGQSATALKLQLGFPWVISPGRTHSSVYVRPFVNYTRLSGGGSVSQWALGGGLGYRIPQGDRMAWRLEAGFFHSLENDNFTSRDTIFGLLGISFYTH